MRMWWSNLNHQCLPCPTQLRKLRPMQAKPLTGRQLSDKQLAEYLQDEKHPRHIQHALVQIGERMTRHDASVTQWYPQVAKLASYPVEEVRNTDAWVMGQD